METEKTTYFTYRTNMRPHNARAYVTAYNPDSGFGVQLGSDIHQSESVIGLSPCPDSLYRLSAATVFVTVFFILHGYITITLNQCQALY